MFIFNSLRLVYISVTILINIKYFNVVHLKNAIIYSESLALITVSILVYQAIYDLASDYLTVK